MNDKMRFEVRFIACTWNYYSMISWLIMHTFSWFKINFNYFYVVMQFIAYEKKNMIWSKKINSKIIFNLHNNIFKNSRSSIVLKLGLEGQPGTRPNRGWNRVELKKKLGKEKPGVTRLTRRPSWPGKIRSKTQLQPVNFFFLLKWHRFDLKKKRIDPGNPMTRSKSGTLILDRTGLKTIRSRACL
jgi:hypothetical protein